MQNHMTSLSKQILGSKKMNQVRVLRRKAINNCSFHVPFLCKDFSSKAVYEMVLGLCYPPPSLDILQHRKLTKSFTFSLSEWPNANHILFHLRPFNKN